jgi:hypothetical protein
LNPVSLDGGSECCNATQPNRENDTWNTQTKS